MVVSLVYGKGGLGCSWPLSRTSSYGTAERQIDNSVLKSPSQLAQGPGKSSKERSAPPWYHPVCVWGSPTSASGRGQSRGWSPRILLRKLLISECSKGLPPCSLLGKSNVPPGLNLMNPPGFREQTAPKHILLSQMALNRRSPPCRLGINTVQEGDDA